MIFFKRKNDRQKMIITPLFLSFFVVLFLTKCSFCYTNEGGKSKFYFRNVIGEKCLKRKEEPFLKGKEITKGNVRTRLFVNSVFFKNCLIKTKTKTKTNIKKKELGSSGIGSASPLFNSYDAKDIVILEGLEAVRKRPGMYIGNTDTKGLHQILFEIIDNSVDEYINYECDKIKIAIHKDESITIEDNGRGIPCDIHYKTKKSALETVLTVLHSGAKFSTHEENEEEENQNPNESQKEEEKKVGTIEGEVRADVGISNSEEEIKTKQKKGKEKKQNTYSAKYKYSSGLHGVGLSVANALSSFMKVKVFRNNKMYSIELEKGKVVREFQEEDCPLRKRGTQIHYKPDPSIFRSGIKHNHDLIANRIHQLAYLNSQLTFLFYDERKEDSFVKGNRDEPFNKEDFSKEKNEFNNMDFYNYAIIKHEGGLTEYIEQLTENKMNLFKDNKIISISCFQKNILIDLRMKWIHNQYSENIISFVNNVNTVDGGSHVDALKTAITKCVNANMKRKEGKSFINVSGEYIREGLTAILSIKMNNPEFEGQTKNKLGSHYLKPIIENILFEKLSEFFDFEPNLLNTVYIKALQAKSSDEEAKAARDLIRSKNNQSYSTILPGKLVDCISDDTEKNEIFIVEGDSAAGSAKQARNREIQAILPLKGKILNVEKLKNNKKIFENSELKSLITAIGLSVNYDVSKNEKLNVFRNTKRKKENKTKSDLEIHSSDVTAGRIANTSGSISSTNSSSVDVKKKKKEIPNTFIDRKLRYGKIIIMTDADVDGEHIRILLLTFLYRFQKEIIEKGNVYVACPPLYKIKYNRFYDCQIKDFVTKQFNTTMKDKACIIHTYSDKELTRLLKLLDADERIRQRKCTEQKEGDKQSVDNISNNKENENDTTSNYVKDILSETEKIKEREIEENNQTEEKTELTSDEETTAIDDKTLFKVSKKYEIQRFKGLGEMMADQLWNTTMNPHVRKLIRVTVNDAIKANDLIFSLMGDDSKLRKSFILENTNLTLL